MSQYMDNVPCVAASQHKTVKPKIICVHNVDH